MITVELAIELMMVLGFFGTFQTLKSNENSKTMQTSLKLKHDKLYRLYAL